MPQTIIIDIDSNKIERLRKLLSVEHEHWEGMNECPICEKHLITGAIEEITALRHQLHISVEAGKELSRQFKEFRLNAIDDAILAAKNVIAFKQEVDSLKRINQILRDELDEAGRKSFNEFLRITSRNS